MFLGITVCCFICMVAAAKPEFILPKIIYAAPGIESNIYFSNVFTSVAPHNFAYVVKCPQGRQENKRWCWTPNVKDAGKVIPMTLEAYDDNGLAASASCRIQVAAPVQNPDRKFTLALLAASSANNGYPQHILDVMKQHGFKNYTPVGSHCGFGAPLAPGKAAHDGYGGWGWDSFLHQWSYSEAEYNNIQDQAEREQMKSFGITTRPGIQYRLRSPLLNRKGGKVYRDVPGWFKKINAGNPPDFIVIDLGANNVFLCTESNLKETLQNKVLPAMTELVNEIRKAAPLTVIGITTRNLGCSQDGFGANYGCKQSRYQWLRNIRAYNQLVLDFIAHRQDPDIIEVPLYQNIDSENSYPIKNVPCHARTARKVLRQSNALHSTRSGGMQFGDAIYCWLRVQMNRKNY